MALTVRIARTPDEVRAVQAFRHRVFVEQERSREPRPDGLIIDEWDHLSADVSRILVAFQDDRIVGTLRFTLDDGRLNPATAAFPFQHYLSPGVSRVAGSSLCVDQELRGHRVAIALISMFHHHARAEGVAQIYAAVNPVTWRLFEPMGVRRLVDDHVDALDDESLPIVPFVFDMRDLKPQYLAFLERHDLEGFLDVWVRRFFRDGELVARRGTRADVAYVVVGGEAEVHLPDGRRVVLDKPYIFGDEPMSVGGDWPYDVRARGNLECIVLERATYFERVAANPKAAVRYAEALQGHPPRELPDAAPTTPQGGSQVPEPVAQQAGQRR